MKVLICRFSSLGDVILASSLLNPLYEKGITVDFLTFKPFGDLYRKDYRLNRVIEIDKKDLKSLKDIKNLTNNLKNNNYDYFLDIHSNLRTILLSKFLGVKTYRYKKNSIKRRLFLYKPFRNVLKDNKFNVVKAYLEILKNLNIIDLDKYRPELILLDEDFKGLDFLDKKNVVVLGTGARYKNKMYPYFSDLARILIDFKYTVVLLGSEEDKKLDKNIYPSEVIDLRGKLSLRQSLAVIQKATGTISNDSAIAHMSRAVKTPVLMIYGATHPYFGFYPFKDEGDYIIKNIECQPCDLHGKKSCKYEKQICLEISPEKIFHKFTDMLDRLSHKNITKYKERLMVK